MISNRTKLRIIPLVSTLILVALVFVFFSARQPDQSRREKVLLETVMQALSVMHYDPAVLNDQFSESVFENYLSSLDYNKKFLLQTDVDKLSAHKQRIDDQLRVKDVAFFEDVEKVIVQRIDDASAYFESILNAPFDFDREEAIELDPKKNVWATNPDRLRDEWRKALKYQVMLRVAQDLDLQETALEKNDTTIKQRSFEEIEQAAREGVMKTHVDYFERLKRLTREDRYGMFINAIGSVFDPHTNFYPPKLKDDFDIAMSGRLEGIGAVLTQRGGYIQVEEIMPGSPSWKQGELKAGDIILKVAQGDAEAVDVTSMRLDDAVKLIRGKKGTEARLTVRKKITEEIVVISIIRDVVEMEQTYARSAIINTTEGKRIGYIFLPKFYVDFNNPYTGRNCADDVRKELQKLVTEGIDALVFDLRNNGGGSLQDVVKMTGYFIPRGPIVQVRDKLEGFEVLADTDPSVIYGGPMIVMVNSGSASASEIMAAALQDYRRAIVVGATNTFGKGTVQRMIDLDRMLQPADASLRPIGALKLTTQKFYRINGGATQLKGVNADIILPDRYSYIDFGEKDLDNPMSWSSINPVKYDLWTGVFGDIQKLRAGSAKRIAASESFSVVETLAKRLKDQRDETKETLHLSNFRAKQKERKEENDRLNAIFEKETKLEVLMTRQDANALESDTLKSRIMKEWVDGLKSDIYLEETSRIMMDVMQVPAAAAGKKKKK